MSQRTHRRLPTSLVAVAAAAVVAACSSSETAEAKCGERSENVTINIIATAENVGEIDECGCKVNKKGGFPRRLTYVDSVRTANEATLVLDAGNWADMSPGYGEYKSDFILDMMTRVGTDATTLGRRELHVGWKHFAETVSENGPKLLASNLVLNGEPVLENTMVRDVGCVRVGTFALIGETVLAQAAHEEGLEVDDIYTSADRIVESLVSEGAEIIVMLAQTQLSEADSLLRRLPEIDVAVLGYQGGLRRTHAQVGESIIVRPGRRGQYVGLLELEVSPDGEVVSFGGGTYALGENIEKNADVQALIKEAEIEVERLENEAKDAAAAKPAGA